MLKIKDDVELKELEKFGFEEKHYGYCYYPNNNSPSTRYFSSMTVDIQRKIRFDLENMSVWCNDLEQLELDFLNIEKSYEAFVNMTNNLIKADLVEKVGD